MDAILRARNIHKHFGGIRALRGVNFDVRPGEVHALVGENGAGKSTLIKILSGVLRPTEGHVEYDGRPVDLADPREAQRLGIATVYQDPLLFPDLSVLDNLFMGREPVTRLGNVNRQLERERADGVLAQLGLDSSILEQPLSHLSLAQRQLVLIAKALLQNARVLVFDEPTAMLTDQESDRLFSIIRGLKQRGVGIIYISHRLEEVFQLGDRVTVLRDGEARGTFDVVAVTQDYIIELMAGKELHRRARGERGTRGQVVLRVEGLTSSAGRFGDVTFEVRAGEILGFFGLVGSGRSELMQTLVGIIPVDSGRIWLRSTLVRPGSPAEAKRLGIAYLPEDRKGQGLFGILAVHYNLSVAVLERLRRAGVLVDSGAERDLSNAWIADLGIRAPGLKAPVSALSGGNQQKVVLARWLASQPAVLILDEPTRGIDVASKEEIHRRIMGLADQGTAILLVSSELPEILKLSDRIAVMHDGRVVGEFNRRDASAEMLLRAAMGRDTSAASRLTSRDRLK